MKAGLLFIFACLFFLIFPQKAFAQLQWPLDTFTLKGTFGDYRGGFHGGIDLHNTTLNTRFKPVRTGTIYKAPQLWFCGRQTGDCTVLTKYQSGGNIEYHYTHIDEKTPHPTNPIFFQFLSDGTQIDNILYQGYLGTITDFGQGNTWANHLHLTVIDQSGNKKDPLYNGNSTDFRLNLTQYPDTKVPTLVELVVAQYSGQNQITVLNSNHLPYNTNVDFIVYIHDRPSPPVSWDEKVGVNWIEWGVTEASSPPTPPSTWNQFVKFTDKLPTSTAEAEAIYALSNAISPGGRTINTRHSGQPITSNHVDEMWYIVTNSDGTTNYTYNQSYAWTTPGQTADRHVWIRARDSNGVTKQDYVQIHIDPTSAVEDNLPSTYVLQPNYPDPFNPETSIPYELPAESEITIRLYNAMGQQVVELVNAKQEAGRYIVFWNGRDAAGNSCPSGVYFLKMEARGSDDNMQFSDVEKLVLVR